MFRPISPINGMLTVTVKHNQRVWWYIGGRHKGIDLRTRNANFPTGIGRPIHAIESGEWKAIKHDKFMGLTVVLRHEDGFESIYGHLNDSSYLPGFKQVKKGDIIGRSGKSGLYCFGSHLHLQIKKDGIDVDPLRYLTNL